LPPSSEQNKLSKGNKQTSLRTMREEQGSKKLRENQWEQREEYAATCMSDHRRGLLTHDSELQAITAPLLISTIHESPQHPLSLFQPGVYSPAIPWQRLLTMESLQLHALRFYLRSLPCRTHSIRVTIRLAVCRQSVRLGDKPLETHDQYFFPTEYLQL
jgi:hypothetical protein